MEKAGKMIVDNCFFLC